MVANYDVIRNWPVPVVRQRYDRRDTIIYNLGIGAGAVATLADVDLTLVWEERLRALPTMAAVLARERYWFDDPRTGLDWAHSVHGEQSILWHAPIPSEGEVIAEGCVEELYDKGEGRGALLVTRHDLRCAASGSELATIRQTVFFRRDGGFGGTALAPKPRRVPDTPPDIRRSLVTRPEQALLYRLSGDLFPLHVDPAFARANRFDTPIIHGLCTYGIAGAAVVDALCGGDGDRLRQLDARFSSAVLPGDRLDTLIWRLGPNEASYRCLVGDRIVIDNGYARFD
ncbi:MAG: MaoC-like dehydratase [Sphingomonadales bacterium]|nr:MaoC-like dehydratase [Sphingomonadales bacterium]